MISEASRLISILTFSCALAASAADEPLNPGTKVPSAGGDGPQDVRVIPGFVVIPSATNVIRFGICTNAAPDAPHLVNTFEIEAYGEPLLQSPRATRPPQWLEASNACLHNVLVNGAGPRLAPTNSMSVIEEASGPEWTYVALDASAAYGDRVKVFRRGLLFVEPDLFVLHDHLVGKEPLTFQMFLHPPAATGLDPVWHDLRLDLAKAGFRIHAPAARHTLRSWERIESSVDGLLPGTMTLRLGPTNKLTELNVVTVFAVYRTGATNDYAFKLLESNTAIGARIHRQGLPTLVAFRIDPAAESASLTGFGFRGPVGVDVFKPKRRVRP